MGLKEMTPSQVEMMFFAEAIARFPDRVHYVNQKSNIVQTFR
jgi:hypothetical protein